MAAEKSSGLDLNHFKFQGRWAHQKEGSCSSAPASSISFKAVAKSITFDLEGLSRWRLDKDGTPMVYFQIDDRETKTFGADGGNEIHEYRLIKISETNPGSVCVHSIKLDEKGKFLEKPKASNRRIEFIGDSFTVGFGNEGMNTDPEELVFEKTDASKSYAFLLAEMFKADYQINAVSGRGLVRNYANIAPEWPLERLYNYTVSGEAESGKNQTEWNLQEFHPQVIVVFVGINDFQGEPPYADKEMFKTHYAAFLDKLRAAHPGVKFVLVSTKVWPNDDLTPTIQAIYDAQIAKGHKDLEFKIVQTENVGALGHPNVRSHQALMVDLKSVIGRLGGFLSR